MRKEEENSCPSLYLIDDIQSSNLGAYRHQPILILLKTDRNGKIQLFVNRPVWANFDRLDRYVGPKFGPKTQIKMLQDGAAPGQ
jgi:hypothetical protein